MQSVYKFPLALAVLNEVEKGRLRLEQKVLIDKAMQSHYNWSPLKKQHPQDSIVLTLSEVLEYCVSWSDNLACDVLFELAGGTEVVNAYLKKLGYKEIQMAYTELEMGMELKRMYDNYATPVEMTKLLRDFYQGKILNKIHTNYLMGLMTQTHNSPARLNGMLPPDWSCAHKTGTGGTDNGNIYALNDVGIINLIDGTQLIISVFVMDSQESYAETEQLIARIAFAAANEFCHPTIAIATEPLDYGSDYRHANYLVLNGAKHYYEVYGEGEPLLLIHGNSTPIKGWKAQIDFFRDKYKVYAIDSRGRGKSELGEDSLSYALQAEDMAQFIEKLRLEKVKVVGKSDGAIIALLLGMKQAQKIHKIVAFSANLQADTNAFYPQALSEIHPERLKAEAMLAKKDSSKNWEIEVQRYRMMEFQPNIRAEDLQQVKVPVLVMSTDRDVIKESHTFFIYQHLPHANLCILPNERHALPRLNPHLFNSTVENYLKSDFHAESFRFEK